MYIGLLYQNEELQITDSVLELKLLIGKKRGRRRKRWNNRIEEIGNENY